MVQKCKQFTDVINVSSLRLDESRLYLFIALMFFLLHVFQLMTFPNTCANTAVTKLTTLGTTTTRAELITAGTMAARPSSKEKKRQDSCH